MSERHGLDTDYASLEEDFFCQGVSRCFLHGFGKDINLIGVGNFSESAIPFRCDEGYDMSVSKYMKLQWSI